MVDLAHDIRGAGPPDVAELVDETPRPSGPSPDGTVAKASAAAYAARLPRARLRVWAGVGHYPHLVGPLDFEGSL